MFPQMQAEGLYNMPHGLRPPSMAPPSLLPNFPGIRPPSGFDNVGTLSDITNNFLSDAEIILCQDE